MPVNQRMEKKMWYIYTMEYYTVVKNNDILAFSGKWMDLEKKNISREVTQTQRDKYNMSSLISEFISQNPTEVREEGLYQPKGSRTPEIKPHRIN